MTRLSDMPAERRHIFAPPVWSPAARTVTGTLGKVGEFSKSRGRFVELFARGSLNKALGDALPVLVCVAGDRSRPLGHTKSGSARLRITERGHIVYTVHVPDTTDGREVAELVAAGAMIGSVYDMRVIRDDWQLTPRGYLVRVIDAAALILAGPTAERLDGESRATNRRVAMCSLAARLGIPVDDIAEMGPAELATRLAGTDMPLTPSQRRLIIERQAQYDERRAELAALAG